MSEQARARALFIYPQLAHNASNRVAGVRFFKMHSLSHTERAIVQFTAELIQITFVPETAVGDENKVGLHSSVCIAHKQIAAKLALHRSSSWIGCSCSCASA